MIQKGMPVREQIEEKKLMVKKGDKVREINDFEWRTYSQMGYKLIGKDGDVMKEDRYAGARKVFETITAVKNKAEKSGMPYSVLKKVYDRGMAAWKGGHRPGATQQQWALARVNSFVTKSSGTWGGADKDLAAKVRGSKK
jgi:predicted DNA binding CopG/RHH family protein